MALGAVLESLSLERNAARQGDTTAPVDTFDLSGQLENPKIAPDRGRRDLKPLGEVGNQCTSLFGQ
jgi:hypothetical protein